MKILPLILLRGPIAWVARIGTVVAEAQIYVIFNQHADLATLFRRLRGRSTKSHQAL